jgi:hypothetical protein
MRERTVKLLAKLESLAWFQQVGEPCGDAVVVVGSWADAVNTYNSPAWKTIRTETQNQLMDRIEANEKPNEVSDIPKLWAWDGIVKPIGLAVVELIGRKAGPLIAEKQLPQTLEGSIRWDLVRACMEAEYAERYPPGFYTNLLFWYLRGHFPCGAQGIAKKVDVEGGGYTFDVESMYPPGFYDQIAIWDEKGFGNWQGAIPVGKLVVY